MATLTQEGINYFVWVKVSSSYVQVGCANSITEDETSSVVKVNCDSNGVTPQSFYGTKEQKVTIGGTYFLYDTSEETTNFSLADFRAAMRAKTKLDLRIGSSATVVTTKVTDYTGSVITSINVASQNGDMTTYNVGFECDSVAETTIAS